MYGQEGNEQDILLNRNAIYGNIGVGGFYFTATGYYEGIVIQKSNISHFVKVGIGGYGIWGVGGFYTLGQYGILTGRKKHHLELSAGPNWFLSGDLQGQYPISGTIGWWIQKPGSQFLFRIGTSFPEAFYVGIGTSY